AIFFAISFLFAACSDNDEQNETADNSNENQIEDQQSNTDQAGDSEAENEPDSPSIVDTDETETINKEDNTASSNQEENALDAYSTEEIECARVWLQLGVNQEIDELNVRHIPAGEPINPDDDTSAVYPEDVIQLAGSRLIDGSITYSGNGDGTINEYNVPLRWDGEYPAGEAFYIDIIENTTLESIDPGEEEAVIELINLLNIQ